MSVPISDLKPLLAAVAAGRHLSESEAEAAFEIIMSGNATPSQIGAFLMALRVRGESVDEITGAARIMRAKALAIEAPPGTIDTVGTGGDASGTFNISTASALVVAGCGVPVAKHGNRAFSSKSGAADVLAALGVNIDCDMDIVRRYGRLRFLPGEDRDAILRSLPRQDRAIASEPFANKHHLHAGDRVTVPLGERIVTLTIAGIYYEYSSSQGYLLLDRGTLLKYLPGQPATNAAIMCRPDTRKRH